MTNPARRRARIVLLLLASTLIAPIVCLAASGPVPPAPTVFAVTATTSELISFVADQPDVAITIGTVATPQGSPIAGCDFPHGGDFSALLCLTESGTLFEVDTQSAAVTVVRENQVPDPFVAFAVDPVNGGAFATTSSVEDEISQLFRIDTVSGIATLSPNSRAEALVINALAVANNGLLYGIDTFVAPDEASQLYRFDTVTGASNLIGPVGFTAFGAIAIDFDERDGSCYIFTDQLAEPVNDVRLCDPQTGSTVRVGTLTASVSAAAIAAGGDLVFADGFEIGETIAWSANTQAPVPSP